MDIRALGTPTFTLPASTLAAAPSPSDSFTASPAETALREIESLLRGHVSRGDEARVLEVLRSLDGPSLNGVVGNLDLDRLVDKIEDHSTGPKNHAELMQLLARQRLGDIDLGNRARLVDALQRGRTPLSEERAIADVFCGTTGADLTRLKDAVDAGDYHDLQELVFHDIDDDATRTRLLDHLKTAPPDGLRMMSDIDDTFYANWVDERYPEKTVYPGVLQFYREMSPRLAFVTARPDERTGTVKDMVLDSVHKRGAADAVVLAGKLTHFVGKDRIAEMKYRNYENFRALHPSSAFSFVGDSGQGDVAFAQRMRLTPDGKVGACFIHDVVNTPESTRAEFRDQEIYYFDTYAGAALAAFRVGLLDRDALQRVADATWRDMAAIRFDTPQQQAARQAELQRDLQAIADELASRKVS